MVVFLLMCAILVFTKQCGCKFQKIIVINIISTFYWVSYIYQCIGLKCSHCTFVSLNPCNPLTTASRIFSATVASDQSISINVLSILPTATSKVTKPCIFVQVLHYHCTNNWVDHFSPKSPPMPVLPNVRAQGQVLWPERYRPSNVANSLAESPLRYNKAA